MPVENEAKVLIIGNGFDLAHFLPTSYSDFINFVKILDGLDGDLSDVKFDEVFKEKTDNQPGFFPEWLSSVCKYYDTEKMRFDLSKLKAQLNNAWLEYFKPIHEIETWIDFENEINNALSIVSEFSNLSHTLTQKGNAFQYISPSTTGFTQNMGQDFFHRTKSLKLASLKLVEVGGGTVYDTDVTLANAAYYKITPLCQYSHDANGELGVDTQKIVNFLYADLEKFIQIFADYLKIVIESFSNVVNGNLLEDFENFNDIYSFNYTNTINNFYKEEAVISHIHGNINNADELNIVLGVSEVDTQILGISALSFTKYFQTLFKGTDFEFLDDEASPSNLHRDGVDYFIWGHSLDSSDQKYIKRVFREISYTAASEKSISAEWTTNNHGQEIYIPNSSITIYFHNQSSKAKMLKNLLDIIGKEVIEKSVISGHLKFDLAPSIWKDAI